MNGVTCQLEKRVAGVWIPLGEAVWYPSQFRTYDGNVEALIETTQNVQLGDTIRVTKPGVSTPIDGLAVTGLQGATFRFAARL